MAKYYIDNNNIVNIVETKECGYDSFVGVIYKDVIKPVKICESRDEAKIYIKSIGGYEVKNFC